MLVQPARSAMLRLLPRLVLFASMLFASIFPLGYSIAVPSPVQAAGAGWYDGIIQYSTITNCVSIIQGAPYTENGAGTYVGFFANPDAGEPAPNGVYYVHVVIAGMGNACSGMRAYIDIALPANTTFAIDGTNKLYCFFDGVPLSPASDCPQVVYPSSYNPGMYEIRSPDSAHAYTWPVPTGRFLEFQIPVRSSTPLTSSTMQARVWMLDGNSSPWLNPQQGVYVFSSQPSILYPNPSTTSITTTTAHSEAYLFTHGVGGTGYFDLGTTTAYELVHEAVTIPAGGNSFRAYDDWGPPPLLPNTLYHWRFSFYYSGGQVIGVDQTFTTLANGTATVGTGLSGSCTAASLDTALAAGGTITFACGPVPVTIQMTGEQLISSNVIINGENKVTLTTPGNFNHFRVQSGGRLTLNQMTLKSGSSSACGGAVRVMANGILEANKSTFVSNATSNSGGAICVETGGTASISFSSFISNSAYNGGGVFNGGTLTMDHSSFTSNTASVFGGALQNYGKGTVSASSFTQNSAGTNGGAIDAGNTLDIFQSVFTGNTAGVRGGAINEYKGTLMVYDSSFAGNHSNNYGGGIANDEGTVGIVRSEFTGNSAANVAGGLWSNGSTQVINSTFSGNTAVNSGGGIQNGPASTGLSIINATLARNSALNGGNLFAGTTTNILLTNTIVAYGSPNNCDVPAGTGGNNLESANTCGFSGSGDLRNANPKFARLQKGLGVTSFYPLLAGSPAIDAGSNNSCPAGDQRGAVRPLDGNRDGSAVCDIGAYEGVVYPVYLPLSIK